MKTLIKNVTIIHAGSEYHLKAKDIYIKDGLIEKIGKHLTIESDRIIEGEGLYCSIGLCDIGTHSGEPGYEHRETIDSLTKSALAGGYTALAVFPNTKPITQNKGEVKYFINHADRNGVEIYPIGALSKDCKGEDISEFLDLKAAGAIAFSDGIHSIHDSGLLSRSLRYADQFDGIIIHHPNDAFLSKGGEMHEGEMSTSLGMKGVPEISELIAVQRDLLINGYSGGRLMEHCLSSKDTVELIAENKKTNQSVFASVAYLNLLKTDQNLNDFDTNLKVLPVLRSEADKQALIAGLKNNTIDVIVSNHTPLEEEVKLLEFPFAKFGASGLETCLVACLTNLSGQLGLENIVHKMTIVPRSILHIPIPQIKEGDKVNLCVFQTGVKNQYRTENVQSKSLNNPLIGDEFSVRVLGTFV
jgi:dihydroorotase